MDIDVEIQLKKDLEAARTEANNLEVEAAKHARQAEEVIADASVHAYNQGAPVIMIASALNTNRQRVYLLLASKGIRPGKDVVDASV